MTRTWFSPTRPLRTRSAWIDCEAAHALRSQTLRCMASLFTIWSVAVHATPTTYVTACCQTARGQEAAAAMVWGGGGGEGSAVSTLDSFQCAIPSTIHSLHVFMFWLVANSWFLFIAFKLFILLISWIILCLFVYSY